LRDLIEFKGFPPGIHGEFLYLIGNSILKDFTENFVYLFLIIATFAVGLNCYSSYKYSPYPLVSVFLYYSHPYLYKELIQMRAGLACAVVLFSIQYLVSKRFWPFAFFCAAGNTNSFSSNFGFAGLLAG
jgi:hypothetical protein